MMKNDLQKKLDTLRLKKSDYSGFCTRIENFPDSIKNNFIVKDQLIKLIDKVMSEPMKQSNPQALERLLDQIESMNSSKRFTGLTIILALIFGAIFLYFLLRYL